jgi:hypothetical protein
MSGEDVLARCVHTGDPCARAVVVVSATAMPDDVERA